MKALVFFAPEVVSTHLSLDEAFLTEVSRLPDMVFGTGDLEMYPEPLFAAGTSTEILPLLMYLLLLKCL